jgi:hypothetical protein
MFKIETTKSKKLLTISVGGFFKENEGIAFLEEYKKNVGSIIPSEYALLVDGTELSTSKPEMLPILSGCLKLYKSTGFKKTYGIFPKSPTATIQLKKLCISSGMDMEFFSTIEEVLNKL